MTNFITDPTERTRFIKFAIVGSIGALVDFAVFNILTKFLALNPVLASVISFAVAVSNNFIWNRYWTYPDSRSKPLTNQLGSFGLINLIGVAIRTPVFALIDGPLEILFEKLPFTQLFDFMTPIFLGHNGALAIAIILVMFWNYFVNRFWTYNDIE